MNIKFHQSWIDAMVGGKLTTTDGRVWMIHAIDGISPKGPQFLFVEINEHRQALSLFSMPSSERIH